MKNVRAYWLALLFVLLRENSVAQSGPAWPRHAATGRVEFTGVLPWPTPPLPPAQQDALVRRWYTAKLTDVKPADQGKWTTTGATYLG